MNSSTIFFNSSISIELLSCESISGSLIAPNPNFFIIISILALLLGARMETLYVIEVEKGESELDLFYSSTGILVKTVVDTGHEEDYDDYLPQPDANGIIAIVKQKYPNATIVEIEREKGLQEVTILDENKEKEVYFNERNEWMGTSWDVQVANLPEAVKKSVMEKYSDYVIDDADYVVTPDNEWYILDLENKQIDKELKVKVDKDGVWL